MLLNTLRVEGMDPERILRNSFHQYQNDKILPELKQKLEELEKEYESIKVENDEPMEEYFRIQMQLKKLKAEIHKTIIDPINILPFIQPGRLVHIVDGETDWGWGIIIHYQKRMDSSQKNAKSSTPSIELDVTKYIVDVLLPCTMPTDKRSPPTPADPNNTDPDVQVIPVLLPLINEISSLRIYIPKDLMSKD